MTSLKDNVVIVTGASAGIGLGVARQAVLAGANVFGFDINDAAARSLTDVGAKFVKVDVADPVGFSDAVKAVRKTEGRLHGLVNNAGLTLTAPFLEFEFEQMERLWAVNQRSVLIGCQAAARIMAADGTLGSLVNIGSNHNQASDQTYEAYAGTKGAVAAMTRAMAWSLGRYGIRANTLAPGLTMTEVVTRVAEDPVMDERFRSWHALNAVNTVDEIGKAAVFLLSDASSSITGSEIVADKGMSGRLGNLKIEE